MPGPSDGASAADRLPRRASGQVLAAEARRAGGRRVVDGSDPIPDPTPGGNTTPVEPASYQHGPHSPAASGSPAVEPGWARAVAAFFDPSTIAGGVTHAWRVTASGAVDPERLAQLLGIPQTLDAMLAWFGVAPTIDTEQGAAAMPGADWR